jgi:adenine-specific DNA-methyltransferase
MIPKNVQPPQTESIKYAGSKLKIIPYIIEEIAKLKNVRTILDGFSGSTRVAQALAQLDYNVTANDNAIWSNTLANCYLRPASDDKTIAEILDHLNNLKPMDGWFSKHYGGMPEDTKKPFQIKNTRKLDAIREEIDVLNLMPQDKNVVLTSLMLALDAVDSTIGHFAAYLAKWSPRSYKDLTLKLPKRFPVRNDANTVINQDVFQAATADSYDLAYLDPPYGSNNDKMPPSRIRYQAYYHFWKTVILNDKPKLFGKAMRREDSRDLNAPSVFEEYRKDENGQFIAIQALRKLLKETNANYILLSYSSGGRATQRQLHDIIHAEAKLVHTVAISHKHNVMASMNSTKSWISHQDKLVEYLFLIEN